MWKSPQVITQVGHLSKLKVDITGHLWLFLLSLGVASAAMNRPELLGKMKPFTILC